MVWYDMVWYSRGVCVCVDGGFGGRSIWSPYLTTLKDRAYHTWQDPAHVLYIYIY